MTETLEQLRERLLGQHNVQQMIQVRAYEIYRMRGGQPGGEAHDWFRAESEVLAFLLADESPRDDQTEAVSAGEIPPQVGAAKAPVSKKPKSGTSIKPTAAKASATKKATARRSTPKKPEESKPKSKRVSKKPQAEESDR